MEVSYSALDAEAGLSYDTTVRVSVQPNRYYPDYVAVTGSVMISRTGRRNDISRSWTRGPWCSVPRRRP